MNAHFTQEFLEYQQKQGQPHEDSWTLYFLSKVICMSDCLQDHRCGGSDLMENCLVYPAIAEGIDEDSSGFVSVHEVSLFESYISCVPSDVLFR